jgi:hypothetical protein
MMTKEEIVEYLTDGICLYDPQENVLYQPDVNDEGVFWGIQIFHIKLSGEELEDSFKEYKNQGVEDKDILYFWTRNKIPAPGVFRGGDYGYADWFGFEYDEDKKCPTNEDSQRGVNYFAERLVKEGVTPRLLTETEAIKHLGGGIDERESGYEGE